MTPAQEEERRSTKKAYEGTKLTYPDEYGLIKKAGRRVGKVSIDLVVDESLEVLTDA